MTRCRSRATKLIVRIARVGIPSHRGDGGMALQARLTYPFGIVVEQDRALWAEDTHHHPIRRLPLE